MKPPSIITKILIKRQRLPVPDGVPADLAELMCRCWAHEPNERPTFREIALKLQATTPRMSLVSPRDSESAGFKHFESADSSVAQGSTKMLTCWTDTAGDSETAL